MFDRHAKDANWNITIFTICGTIVSGMEVAKTGVVIILVDIIYEVMSVFRFHAQMFQGTGITAIDPTNPAKKRDRFPTQIAFHDMLALGFLF